MTFRKSLLDNYWKFINERHAIYIRRERGDPWPWTEDELLQKYKFTNIFRELDTGTIWLREHIRDPYEYHNELFFNIALYRLYNYTGTAQEILDKVGFIERVGQLTDVFILMNERRKAHKQVFTGAHMITGTLGGDKVNQIFGICAPKLWDKRRELEPTANDTLETAFHKLCSKSPGYGAFISYEVITDLRHTRYLNGARDIFSWANPGPGARRGLCRLMGLQVRAKKGEKVPLEIRHKYPNYVECIEYMHDLLSIQDGYKEDYVPTLEMRDIEHSLCEWDKYQRVLNGEGKPRSKFTPPHLRTQV